MERQKIDKFIDAFRSAMYQEFQVDEEGGMVANAPGAQGGFSATAPAKGPVSGLDPTIGLDGRNKYVKKYIAQLMAGKEKRSAKKAKKNALKYNPYFK